MGSGSYFNFPRIIPTVTYADKLGAPLSEGIKEAVRHAKVQAESHIRTPENADYVIASDQADMLSIVRGQIADPHLANKARDGNAEDIRPCISCNQMCWGRRYRDYWISCLINPSAGREFKWGGDRFERTAADIPVSERLRTLNVQFITESAVDEWLGDAALIMDLTNGEKQKISFDTLVLSTPNMPFNNLEQELRNSAKEFYRIGDCVAARQANAAIFEGRRLGLKL